jgi:hypothetical protein
VHLLPYEFLLKDGLLGFAWLAAFVAGVVILGISALETATRQRDPTLVVYAALPLLGLTAALAAATHLQDNPLNAFALGVLVVRLEPRVSPSRVRILLLPASALICGAVGAVAFSGSVGLFPFPGPGAPLVPSWNTAAVVGGVRFAYPPQYHRRYFATSSHAVTGVHGVRVHGVVVASYPLKRNPEFGGSGQSFPPDGVFFELYRAPRHGPHLGPTKKLPLILFDFPAIVALANTDNIEQGAAFFRVHGHNYQAILWVGKHAPKGELLTVDGIIDSIATRQR